MKRKGSLLLFVSILTVCIVAGCASLNKLQVTTTVTHDTKHHSALTAIPKEEFENLSFGRQGKHLLAGGMTEVEIVRLKEYLM